MSRWNKVLYAAAWATLLAAMALILTITFWLVVPYRGLYNVPQPFVVATDPVEVGQLVRYKVSYCVDERLPLPITVQRELELQGEDGLLFPLAPPVGYLIKERRETRPLSFGVPFYIPPGTYHIHYTTGLQVSPFRVIDQSFISADFHIVPSTLLLREAGEAASFVKETAKNAAAELKSKK